MKQYIKKINFNLHKLPVVISIPHSGTEIPLNVKKQMVNDIILPNMDWYIPDLYSFLENLNYTVIISTISRYVIDLNRNFELINGTNYKDSLIYTKTTYGDEMYNKTLTLSEKEDRITKYYNPYHRLLEIALQQKIEKFGYVYLLDLHSFGKNNGFDLILGNAHGKSASNKITIFFKNELEKEGFCVNLNSPYPGGYITKHYGTNIENCEALQLEISYKTYIEKRQFEKEEMPQINEELFRSTSERLKRCFVNFRNNLLFEKIQKNSQQKSKEKASKN